MVLRRAATAFGIAADDPVLRQPRWATVALEAVAPDVLVDVRTRHPAVALTFDDGPEDAVTPALLDVLARHGAHATFFLTGDQVAGRRTILERMVADGHELGNHLMHAEPTVRQPTATFERDLLRCHRLLASSGDVRWFRPASGWIRPNQLAVARRHGYRCALGSVVLLGQPVTRPAAAADLLLRRIQPGAIVVLHEGSAQRIRIVETVDRLLTRLLRSGYAALTLSELVDLAWLGSGG